ncbi:MAG: peptide-methionine (S)-S-oxide reductase MsrA [Treponemataceae bacterium]|nr:peptide-methionine (S)-S-oxide reductase MsrA [Treponemataceae bacterium]
METKERAQAYLGGGCFWCMEAVFEMVPGVIDVTNGYAGGTTPKPTYQAVCTGKTGHAEVVRITYDPAQISYVELLDIFFSSHDPTTENRQGADVGPQYRSIILYQTEEEATIARQKIQEHQAYWHRPIVTEVVPLTTFWEAEEYHQDYYRNHPYNSYCQFVISPKVEKIKSHTLLRQKNMIPQKHIQ